MSDIDTAVGGQSDVLDPGRPIREADIVERPRHVCFTPNSGHSSVQVGCPKSATSGHFKERVEPGKTLAAGIRRKFW